MKEVNGNPAGKFNIAWAPNRADIQENWVVQLFRPFESLCAPGIPIHRLCGSTIKIDGTLSAEMVAGSCLRGIHSSKRQRNQQSQCPEAVSHAELESLVRNRFHCPTRVPEAEWNQVH
jgi:hypothetical protein